MCLVLPIPEPFFLWYDLGCISAFPCANLGFSFLGSAKLVTTCPFAFLLPTFCCHCLLSHSLSLWFYALKKCPVTVISLGFGEKAEARVCIQPFNLLSFIGNLQVLAYSLAYKCPINICGLNGVLESLLFPSLVTKRWEPFKLRSPELWHLLLLTS